MPNFTSFENLILLFFIFRIGILSLLNLPFISIAVVLVGDAFSLCIVEIDFIEILYTYMYTYTRVVQ